MLWRDLVACGVGLGLSAAAAHAQPADPHAYLDILVSDARGRAPLTAADISITDAEGTLAVDSLRLVDVPIAGRAGGLPPISSPSDERDAAGQADRLVGIFLDEYHLQPGEALETARAQVASFVRTAFGPRDLFVVIKPLDSLTSLRLTGDRDMVAAQIASTDGRLGLLAPRNRFEQDFIAGDPRRIEEARGQIALSAIGALSSHLGQFEGGRKTLLVLSDALAGRSRLRRGDGGAGIDDLLRTATRGRVSVYVISPTDSPAAAAVDRQGSADSDLLDRLAGDTGGARSRGVASLEQGLQTMLREASRYYLLGIVPREGQRDGRVHPVQVAPRRPGVAVRSRVGFSVADEQVMARLAPPRPIAPTRLLPRRMSPLVQVWFGMSGEPGASPIRVSFVWEPAARVPGERSVRPPPQRVALTVTTLDGAPVFSGTALPTGQPIVDNGRNGGRLAFDTEPGPLVVQMDILDTGGTVLDRDVRDLLVKPVVTPFAFGTPEVFRARTMRDIRALSGRADVPPVASRSFSRTEHVLVRVPIGGNPTGPVAARLVSAVGAVLRTLPTETVGGSPRLAEIDLGLAAFAPGPYMLEFFVPSTTASPIERVSFTITP